ncbi:UDP-glycosyltransferase 79B6 [Quercus suber]|uniref:Udp-glycosyltransferase 79b6 n=1 Tax=Quercus suber TaxID=58331 RepID=A0AAW0IRI6_QUESU
MQALKVPTKEKPEDMTVEDFMQSPPGYPPSCVRIKSKDNEIAQLKVFAKALGTKMSLYVQITYGLIQSDALSYRTYHEFEGPYCDYLRQHYAKPVLLTGPVLPEALATKLAEKWTNWLCNFEQGTVVYCAFGSQNKLQKDQFQELLLGFELCGQPFLVALSTPNGCATIEEAFPEGFEERVKGRGWVYGDGCHKHYIGTHLLVFCDPLWLMVEEFKVAVEVEREDNGWISKESLSKAIISVMTRTVK